MSSSWSVEVESKAAAVPLFKAAFTDWHNLGPKLVPDIISSITIISGTGNPGSIRQINFAPGGPYVSVKERLESIDHEELHLKISVLEGGDLGKKYESTEVFFKVEPKGNGSVVKLVGTYKAIPGHDLAEDIEKAKHAFIKNIKAVEEYLAANPGAYA